MSGYLRKAGKVSRGFFRGDVAGNLEGEQLPFFRDQAQGWKETVGRPLHMSRDDDPPSALTRSKISSIEKLGGCQQQAWFTADKFPGLIHHKLLAKKIGLVRQIWKRLVHLCLPGFKCIEMFQIA